MLELCDIELGFDAGTLFSGLNLKIAPGEICLLTAPSGAGKSSLLRWMAGLETPRLRARGQVRLGGHILSNLPAEQRQLGLLFQTPQLFPHLTVADNLGFGLVPSVTGAARTNAITDALNKAGLAGMGLRDPQTLSGGQQARLALLRTLLAQPQALLLDEPFSSLDGVRREEMVKLVREEAVERRLPVLLVSHDPRDEALTDKPPYRLGT
jgi:putative thiamine transport system ATP-binding protein